MAGEDFSAEADAVGAIIDARYGAGQIKLAAVFGRGVVSLERKPQIAERLIWKQPARTRHHRFVGQFNRLARLAREEQSPHIAYFRHRLDVDRVARPPRPESLLVELNALA